MVLRKPTSYYSMLHLDVTCWITSASCMSIHWSTSLWTLGKYLSKEFLLTSHSGVHKLCTPPTLAFQLKSGSWLSMIKIDPGEVLPLEQCKQWGSFKFSGCAALNSNITSCPSTLHFYMDTFEFVNSDYKFQWSLGWGNRINHMGKDWEKLCTAQLSWESLEWVLEYLQGF